MYKKLKRKFTAKVIEYLLRPAKTRE